jgi:hypothetical protein
VNRLAVMPTTNPVVVVKRGVCTRVGVALSRGPKLAPSRAHALMLASTKLTKPAHPPTSNLAEGL